jgi:hypothetical protein
MSPKILAVSRAEPTAGLKQEAGWFLCISSRCPAHRERWWSREALRSRGICRIDPSVAYAGRWASKMSRSTALGGIMGKPYEVVKGKPLTCSSCCARSSRGCPRQQSQAGPSANSGILWPARRSTPLKSVYSLQKNPSRRGPLADHPCEAEPVLRHRRSAKIWDDLKRLDSGIRALPPFQPPLALWILVVQ